MTSPHSRLNRSQSKAGSQGLGGGNGDDHFEDMIGARDLFIYLLVNRKLKGYSELKSFLEINGCVVEREEKPPLHLTGKHEAIKITLPGELLPESVLRKVHRWAHQRNFLHSFFKPYII